MAEREPNITDLNVVDLGSSVDKEDGEIRTESGHPVYGIIGYVRAYEGDTTRFLEETDGVYTPEDISDALIKFALNPGAIEEKLSEG